MMETTNPRLAGALAAMALLVAACATQPVTTAPVEAPMTVDEILASAPQAEKDSDTVNCLHRDAYTDIEVINPELLLFHGRSDRLWLNRLRQSCVGLRQDHTLALDMRNGRLCDLDSVSGVDILGGHYLPGARCSLGKFDPVSPEQADLLKAQLSRR